MINGVDTSIKQRTEKVWIIKMNQENTLKIKTITLKNKELCINITNKI